MFGWSFEARRKNNEERCCFLLNFWCLPLQRLLISSCLSLILSYDVSCDVLFCVCHDLWVVLYSRVWAKTQQWFICDICLWIDERQKPKPLTLIIGCLETLKRKWKRWIFDWWFEVRVDYCQLIILFRVEKRKCNILLNFYD